MWWYFDALTPSGDALVCIFFLGSVFSPDYAWRLRRGRPALPVEHTAVNLALYRKGERVAWVMSEYRGLEEDGDRRIRIGRSTIERAGAGWRIDLDERASPFRQRVTGRIHVEPLAPPFEAAAIAEAGATHGWQVLAPRARVRAEFLRPGFSLEGVGYHDRNHGDGRLEDAFSRWGWARFHGRQSTSVLYSFVDRAGGRRAFWVRATDGETGRIALAAPLPEAEPRRIAYGMQLPRWFGVSHAGTEAAGSLRSTPTTLLEQAPFYARYRCRLDGDEAGGEIAEGIGEQLDLDRFRSPGLQFLLRYKMRRPDTWIVPW